MDVRQKDIMEVIEKLASEYGVPIEEIRLKTVADDKLFWHITSLPSGYLVWNPDGEKKLYTPTTLQECKNILMQHGKFDDIPYEFPELVLSGDPDFEEDPNVVCGAFGTDDVHMCQVEVLDLDFGGGEKIHIVKFDLESWNWDMFAFYFMLIDRLSKEEIETLRNKWWNFVSKYPEEYEVW